MKITWKTAVSAIGVAAIALGLLPLGQLSADDSAAQSLQLKLALEAATQNNIELKLADERVALADERHKDKVDDAYFAKNRKSNDAAQELTYRKQELIDPLTAEINLLESKQQKEDATLEVRLAVESAFYKHTMLRKQLAAVEDELAKVQSEYDAQVKRVENGSAVESSLDAIEIEKMQLEQRRTQLSSDLDLLLLDLSSVTGMERQKLTNLVSVEVPAVKLPSAEQVETWAQELKQSHINVVLAKMRNDAAAKEYEITQVAYLYESDSLNTIKTAEDQAFSARLALRDAEVQAEVKLRSDYNALLNAADSVKIAEMDAERSAKDLSIQEKRRELGMITDTELQQAKITLQTAESALLQAKIDLYMAVERFNHYVSSTAETE